VPLANDLLEQVTRSLNQGEKIYNVVGSEIYADRMLKEHYDDEEMQFSFRLESLLEDAKSVSDAYFKQLKKSVMDGYLTPDSIAEYEEETNEFIQEKSTRNSNSDTRDFQQETSDENLTGETNAEIIKRERETKQREDKARLEDAKAKQKDLADKEVSDIENDFLGLTPKTNDVFGMTNPLEKVQETPKNEQVAGDVSKKDEKLDTLPSIFSKLPKSGAISKKLLPEIDAHSQAELIRNIQKHWTDVLADHGFEDEHGTKGRLTNTVRILC
jgi:hypothetical protein